MRRAAVRRAAPVVVLLVALAALGEAQDRAPAPGTPGEAPRRVLIGASGDLLFHTRVVDAGNAHGFEHLFAGLRSVIAPREIAFANLETPLSVDREPMRGDPPRLGAPPRAAAALAGAGLDVLSVANNHAWDQRHTGLVHTLDTLRARGVAPVGAAPEEADAPGPVVVERDGVRVAFVAFTVILQGYPGTRRPDVRVAMWDERRARRVLARARARTDVVVASMHWGLAYRHEDRSEQRRRAAFLVEHGADLVLGHGPHVLQRVERVASPRGEAVVAYSLGNLISNQGYHFRRDRRDRSVQLPLREPATRDGVWLRVALDVPEPGRVRVGGLEAVPLWTHNNWWDQERRRADEPDVRVVPLRTVDDEALRRERREAIGAVLGDDVNLLP
ncbi:MAG TPA: CapA family protein [Sandaracinaceae bacterium LLY-WYZ-13_1]|nr:CapA family protein [Sandaracinaceae bacterium LLY-WYZ-13_1]